MPLAQNQLVLNFDRPRAHQRKTQPPAKNHESPQADLERLLSEDAFQWLLSFNGDHDVAI